MKKVSIRHLVSSDYLTALVALGCFLYFLSVLTSTGYVSDDAYNSLIRGNLIEKNQSLGAYTWHGIREWFLMAGRLYPAIFYHYSLFYVVQSLLAYKLLTIGVTLASVCALGVFIRAVSGNLKLAFFSVLALPTFFQLRAWHDPLLAFAFSTQLFTLICLVSFISFWRYLQTRTRSSLAWSLFFYVVAALMYELTYFFFIFYFLMAYFDPASLSNQRGQGWWQRARKAVREAAPYFVISGIFLLVFVLVRSKLNPSYNPGYYASSQVTLQPDRVLRALLVQASAAFPLSYYLRVGTNLKGVFCTLDWIYGIILAVASFRVLRGSRSGTYVGLLALVGLTLVLLPSFLIAISGHQQELYDIGYGYGYIFVFMQYFGLIMLIVSGFVVFCRQYPKGVPQKALGLAMSLAVASFGMINLAQNRAVALESNRFYKFPRSVVEAALSAGLFHELSENSVILRNGRFPNDFPAFFENHLGIKVAAAAEPLDYVKSHLTDYEFKKERGLWIGLPRKPGTFLMTYYYDKNRGETGTVLFGKLDSVVYVEASGALLELGVRDLRLFDYRSGVIKTLTTDESRYNFLEFMKDSSGAPLVPERLSFERFFKKTVYPSWEGGFFSLDGTPERNVRWASSTAKLSWYNLSGRPVKMAVSMAWGGGGAVPADLEITFPDHAEKIKNYANAPRYSSVWTLGEGRTEITFRSDGERFSPGDPRDIRFGVLDFRSELK